MAKTKHSTPLRKHDTNDHMGAGALTYEGEEIQKRPDPKTHKETIGKYKLNTWTSPNGQTHRQIDNIAISHKYRNTARSAWAVHGRIGKIAQKAQHAVIKMSLTLKLAGN